MSPFFVRRNPVNARVHKDEDGRKGGLAQQRPFLFAGTPAAAQRYAISLADGEQLGGLAEQRPFVCKDARGSAEICNLALSAEVRKVIRISNL